MTYGYNFWRIKSGSTRPLIDRYWELLYINELHGELTQESIGIRN